MISHRDVVIVAVLAALIVVVVGRSYDALSWREITGLALIAAGSTGLYGLWARRTG